jgi:hypothetical protein
MAYLIAFLLLACSLLTLTFGQERPAVITIPPAAPTTAAKQAASGATVAAPTLSADDQKLNPLGRQLKLSAHAGADWLCRANRPDGRFNYGVLPALNSRLEGDHYLRQAGAAYALAHAARYFNDERMTAVARQAVLTLLADTEQEKALRHTTWPSIVVNRLGAAGLLVLAINELPAPADELLQQSEELCNFIRLQQQADGSLAFMDARSDGQGELHDPDGINYYPGEALYALMRSQQHRPQPWKAEVLRKALAYYRPWWGKHRGMAFVPWQTAAYAEAYLQTGEKPFAEFVFEMNDWITSLQYTQLDPRHPLWVGGFMGYADGKSTEETPQIGSTAYAEGLAEACRVARKAGDVGRYQRYSAALERCLQFALTLQYNEGNTQHFAEWYRPRLLGGFHTSDQDGNLRIDFTQHAIGALLKYLQFVAAQG